MDQWDEDAGGIVTVYGSEDGGDSGGQAIDYTQALESLGVKLDSLETEIASDWRMMRQEMSQLIEDNRNYHKGQDVIGRVGCGALFLIAGGVVAYAFLGRVR